MKWVLILCACAVVSSAMNFPSLKLLLEKEKELLDSEWLSLELYVSPLHVDN